MAKPYVDEYARGRFGITTGKRWFAYTYPSQAKAQSMLDLAITSLDKEAILVCIRYSYPLIHHKGRKASQ